MKGEMRDFFTQTVSRRFSDLKVWVWRCYLLLENENKCKFILHFPRLFVSLPYLHSEVLLASRADEDQRNYSYPAWYHLWLLRKYWTTFSTPFWISPVCWAWRVNFRLIIWNFRFFSLFLQKIITWMPKILLYIRLKWYGSSCFGILTIMRIGLMSTLANEALSIFARYGLSQ